MTQEPNWGLLHCRQILYQLSYQEIQYFNIQFSSVAQSYLTLCPWDSLGKNTGVGGRTLLRGVFLTQGSNPDLLLCRHILNHLNHRDI